jgi:hypothetical protein
MRWRLSGLRIVLPVRVFFALSPCASGRITLSKNVGQGFGGEHGVAPVFQLRKLSLLQLLLCPRRQRAEAQAQLPGEQTAGSSGLAVLVALLPPFLAPLLASLLTSLLTSFLASFSTPLLAQLLWLNSRRQLDKVFLLENLF